LHILPILGKQIETNFVTFEGKGDEGSEYITKYQVGKAFPVMYLCMVWKMVIPILDDQIVLDSDTACERGLVRTS